MHRDYHSYKNIFRGYAMPFAFIDLDLLDENIQQLVKRAGGKKIRVASKSVRSVEILRYIFKAHSQFQGIMAFTIPEALYLIEQGFDDVLLGYPAWHPDSIAAVCQQVKAGKNIVLMVDSVEHVRHINSIAKQQAVIMPLCMDVDMSVEFPALRFGVLRSHIDSPADAVHVFAEMLRSSHVRLDGVMGYEAQIAGVTDNDPRQMVRNTLVRTLKNRSIPQIAQRRAAVIEKLREHHAHLRFVNGGGTGSLESTRAEAHVTEVTVGSGFYASGLFDHYLNFKHLPAAAFAVEIVRRPKNGVYTCLGGGYVASGGAGADKLPTPYLPHGLELSSLEGAGEVQTPVLYKGKEPLALGDPIFFRHSKAGELCERFNHLYLVRGSDVIGEAATYRGEGYSFL